VNDEGFFFDDFQVLGYGGNNAVSSSTAFSFVSIYPNPSNSGFHVFWDEALVKSTSAELVIFDISGKEMIRKIVNSADYFDVPNQIPGTYVCEIRLNGKAIFREKIMVLPN
jgi:hypothetical protein